MADMGAQVLSVIEKTEHPNSMADGHNIRGEDLGNAWELVQSLEASGDLRRVDDQHLAPTAERMLYDGLWAHFFAPKGFTSLLRKFLGIAEVSFNTEAANLAKAPDGRWRVTSKAKPLDDSQTGLVTGEMHQELADTVILAVEAWEAVRLAKPFLPVPVFLQLSKVQYDNRVVMAMSIDAPEVAELFKQRIELDRDDLTLISYQNHRRPFQTPVVVVHSNQLEPPSDVVNVALKALEDETGLPHGTLKERLRDIQSIGWHQAQMIRPVDGDSEELHIFHDTCVDLEGGLVIAGDFMGQSSFAGCYASAAAAARSVLKDLDSKHPRQASM
jgi:hypothetical protein